MTKPYPAPRRNQSLPARLRRDAAQIQFPL